MSDSAAGYILERLDDETALFTLDRPDKLNSLTRSMLDGLAAALDDLPGEGIRVLILTGAGVKSFCAGTDLAEIQSMPADARLAKNTLARQLFFRLANSELISIAALNGLAYGGGLELAMACSFRIAMAHVRVSLPEIKLGLLPAYGGTQFLPSLIPRDRALELMITGRPVDVDEARAIGLITRIASADTPLLDQAQAFAAEFGGFSPTAIAAIRECVSGAGPVVEQAGLDIEDRAVRAVFQTEDAREGVQAFLEKRPAVFSHRKSR